MRTMVKVTGDFVEGYSIGQLMADNPQVSFPRQPTAEMLAEYGVYDAEIADTAPTRFHSAGKMVLAVTDGKATVTREWIAPPLDDMKASAISELSRIRDEKIEDGFDFSGVIIPCDDKSLARYTGARLYAVDYPDTVRKWKLPTGFVELDADTIKALSKAAADFVQACFDEQAAQVGAVQAATDAEEIEAVLAAAHPRVD